MQISTDSFINASSAKGVWSKFLAYTMAATTAANITSGYTSARHVIERLTVPTLGSGVNGAYLTQAKANNTNGICTGMISLESVLGSLTVSGNSFAAGTAMPTKTIAGSSITTASPNPFVLITTTLVATTPILTITYVNQAGTGSRTCTMTLPTNAAAQSVYFMGPHLQSGDSGVRSVSAISISTGSGGVLDVVGALPLMFDTSSSGVPSQWSPLWQPAVPTTMLAQGDLIGITFIQQGSSNTGWTALALTGDV